MSQQQQQQVVRQQSSSVTQQSSSSSSMVQQQSVMQQQQSQVQTRVVREVRQGTQMIQGPTQVIQMGLPAGASPPVFEQIFRNARFAQGGDALFEGKVTGSPRPEVTWMRKGQQLQMGSKYQVTHNQNTGEVTLRIAAIGPGDEGEYTCTASNQYGEAICTVYIQPEAALMMQQQRQQQQSLQQKQTFMQQQTTMQQQSFMQNGQMQSFRVDTFEYRLLNEVEFRQAITQRVANEQDVDLSGPVQGVPQAPQLQQKPRATKVAQGNSATFTAVVSANPSPRVTWFRNGERLRQSEKYQMSQSGNQVTLVVRNVSPADNGHYTLLAENISGATVSSAQLACVPRSDDIVNGIQEVRSETIESQQQVGVETEESSKAMAPKFVKGPGDQVVQEGRMVRFDCRASGRPYPEVTWLLNGVVVSNDSRHKILVNEQGNHSLMITEASVQDCGVLSCIARNKSGEATAECNLSVIEKEQVVAPKFVERFQQGQVSEGETLVLQVRAVGTPTPQLSWQKDGVSIMPSDNVQILTDGGTSSLQLLSSSVADSGWYQCTAQNTAGSTATRARLHVLSEKAAPQQPQRPYFPKPVKVIEPEKEPEPEIIFLRHVERAHHQVKSEEDEGPTEPPRFTHPLRDLDIFEGTRAHFEATVTPVGDATMQVEWLVNGQPIPASSRATATYRFGYVALDILSVTKADVGVYTCRVANILGQDEVTARLNVRERPQIESSSQHPEALQQISYLEDANRYQRTTSIDEQSSAKPTFVKSLVNLGDVQEGKYAHFEAQLHPVSDPFMKIDWFKDGLPITASSRINVIYNFGYVALNIMHLRAEDSGVYTVRAINRMGEASCQSTINVIAFGSVTGDLGIPEQAQYIRSVEEMEAYRLQMQQRSQKELLEASTAPIFRSEPKDTTSREGGYAHFEARLEPIGDPTLKIEWTKDGRPMEASSRITSFFNFGYVALTIKALVLQDQGTYTCRAYNSKGEATVGCVLTMLSKTDEVDSQYEQTAMKMKFLEESARYKRTETEETTQSTMPPKFLGPLKGTNKILEGQKAHFEVRLEPQSDSSMVIEWYFNGQVIMSANRIKFYNDFGYVALDISDVRSSDSGTYTVVAKNSLGQEQASTTMVVETRSSIDYSSMHEVTLDKTRALERRHQEPHYDIEEISKSKPIFTQTLVDLKPICEGKNIHLEARLEPVGDPTMKVEWFLNGRSVTIGSRFKTYFDFGYVALDVIGAYSIDSGEYTCRATNHLGSAHTSSCVQVVATGDIQTDSMHDDAMEQINFLEHGRQQRTTTEETDINQPPNFTKSLKNIETFEGTNIHLEARLQPVGDHSMRVDWFFNDEPLKFGHRFRPAYDFDYVALDLLSVYPVDSGIYSCRATNKLGQAVTSASVKVTAKKDLIFDSEHPESLHKLQYLDDASRYHRREIMEEVSVKIKPKFLTQLKELVLNENQTAHFEAKLEPIADSNLRVQWFKDGRPLAEGSRFRYIHDFGYVALDIRGLVSADDGTYTCVATNLLGKDEITTTMRIKQSSNIIMESQNETLSMQQLKMLEDKSRYTRSEQIEETTKQTPVFTTSLKNVEIIEGQRAHFEARLIPASDPTMKVEWFHNGVVLKSGSRFMEYNDFGYVALDIMYCYAEDSGTYTCVATNAIGQAITECTMTCHSKDSIILDTMNQEAMSKINRLETRTTRTTITEEFTSQAPVFTNPLKDRALAENAPLHFEARLIPVGDPDLKVEWFKNGVPLQQANRISTMHDFGYVALDMKYVNPEDSGTYTCRATNRLGQAVTSASLVVTSKEALLLDSEHGDALHKLRMLEDSSRYTKTTIEETVITQAPTFVVKLSGLTSLWEGQSAHVECRLEPYPDPSMKVEWFHNGKPLSAGSRFRTIYDFGFCALDLLQVVAEDTGIYEVRATNKIGTASSMIEITVKPKSDFIVETVHPDALPKLARLEQKSGYKVSEEQVVIEKPNFGRSLRNQDRLVEGQAVHMEATLTPVNDPTMKVEWFFNGNPIPSGHRFRTTYDFGFVALDILYAYPEDCGTYMCRATNAAGQAVTSCSINVEATGSMVTDTLDEQRMKKIKLLERSDMRREELTEQVFQKPVFTTALQNVDGVSEGERVHLECRLEPVNDPNLKVEWFVNGVEIKAGHRFRTTHDFGYVALDVLYSYSEDSGTYLCKATNKMGEAVNSCSVSITAHRSIYMDTQHPQGWEKIQNLEQRGRYERLEVADLPNQPPRFTSELRGITSLAEGQRAHMEGRIEPIHDPSMRIEWYHNGKILQSAARFHTTFDFGYVALDISSVYEEDSGVYTCRVFNNMGEATSSITFKIEGKSSIIYESARPEGLEKIREMEDHARGQRKVTEEVRTFQRPVFTQPLQNLDALTEGETAHFECRLIPVGDPKLKVEWYRNEVLIETSSRINCTHDFGYVSLDITGIRGDDEGIYMCRAHNDLGEAVTTASMKIKTHDAIQFDTHHPEGMRKIAALESRKPADRGPEQDKVYDKPVFTTNLTGPAQLMEGQRAHYECRVVPIGDPTMQYEWYCNGVNLKMGSRFQTSHDFGFVTLDIMQVIPEDSGVYMCKAFNRAGEAVSSITTRVIGRDSIIGDAAHPEGWEKIRLREAQWNRVHQAPTTPDAQEPPMFTKNLESHDKLMEGGRVHLEAQVQPAHDPHLSIEWFKNGMQLATGTRIRSTFDFGHVTLDISGLRENDCGIYTCKAVNRVGEAVSTCNLKVIDRDWLIGDTVHPDALPKLARLEQPRQAVKSPDDPTYDIPMFITHLNNVECNESETAHFECRVEPSKDPTMKIEWFINGKPMQAASRYHATYDFGFIALDCTHCYAEDSGVYMCRATNYKGSATTTGTLKCISKANLYFDTQHPQGKAGLEKVEEAERAFWSKYQRQESEKEISYPKPVFIRPLQTNFSIIENQLLHMEANVEPKNDPNLRIEWFLNGKPLEEASRFKTSYDFGLVTLDLKDCNERDQGIYTCRAYNKVGEAFCTSTVVVTSKDNLIEGTQHPAGETGLEAILRMEESLRRHDRMLPDEEGHPPVFTTEFKSLSNVEEGEIAHFEAMLTPVGDQTMRVEWFYKDQALKASSRVRTVYAFGMVVLEIVGSKVADSGEYTCKAHNKWGKAECSLTLEVVDRAHGQPPKFTTHIESLDNLKDGASAHFECTLIPIGDPNMKVEWFHNGQPIRNATRIKTVSDFGFVVLDIAYLRDHDSGEWVCKASNKYGEDFTKGTINYRGKGGVYTDSLQPQSLDRIAELEAGKMKSSTPLSPAAAEPPCFITHITNIEHLVEGQSVHFEARLKPVGDPNLTVEWYKDGKKLPSGHRYRTFHDFGIVILDILYCYEEDSGVYEARAVNKLGEDKTTANLKCSSKTGLILTPQVPRGMEGGLDKIQHMEDTAWMRKDTVTSERVGMAPKFTVPLTTIDNLKEGENAHFEARIVPTDDPRLKVEWYWNGKPMKHSSRIRQFCDFGFVIMELSPVYPEDSGEYMCRAYNDYGEAVTKATLKCDGKRSIILESQLPKSMQRGMEKIAELEGLMIKSPDMPTPSDVGQPPQFITEPKDVAILENQLAHFECRLLPVGDPNLRVDWFHNGRALGAGTRIKTINDFGYVILEMSGCYGRDSGTYVCRAVNKHGEASVTCKLEVTSKGGINFDPQATSQFKDCTESIQKLEQSMWKKEDLKFDEEKGSPPRFVTNLENVNDLIEGQPAHFDCRVEPVGDSSMRIDWFHNGIPLAAGSRMHMMDDFGFVVLDLEWTFARDSGEYLCRATNKYGQATTSASLHVRSKHGVDLNSQLPKGMTAEKLKELERGPLTEKYDPDAELTPPKFVVLIKDVKLEEGESAFFEARVEPRHDPNLRIEWYFNGKPLQSGHRFRTSFEMGHVTLTLLHTYSEDSGEYVCRAVNKLGQDITKATLKSRAAQSVVMQSQVPKGMKRMDFATQMEETLKKYCKEVYLTQEDIYEPEKRQPPRFVTQIKDMMELQEMQEAKFECQLAPVGDPNMKVEWFFNGRPLPYKNRFTPIYDFGYVAMIMGWVFAEDSGEYLCRATNLYGMDETRAVIKSTSRPGVIYDSQIPKGMQSLEKIRELESSWQIHPEKFLEEEKVRAKPEILRPPVSLLVQEGEWARFSVRISGHPKPRVMWMVNGSTAMSGNRFKIWYDGMFHLDIPKTRQYDNGKVEVIARNALGEAYAACELKVNPRQDDYRAVLKNSPKQHNETSASYRKPDWVTRMEELKTTMQAEHVEPQFTQEMVDGRVREMENYVFTVAFAGNPKPEISWYHDNLLLHQHQAFQMRVRGDKAFLSIVEASPKHKGEYVCRAVNSAGECLSKATLEVIELTYEEKLKIANERYAALSIQHAAEHMKVKERERSEREKVAHKEAMEKMREDRHKAIIDKEKELEEAKLNTWKPQRRVSEIQIKKVEPQTPKEHRIAQVYSNWKAPVAFEDSYPEIEPEEFSPNQIPGVKCFVKVSDTSIRGEEVVKEIAPKFFEDEQVVIELAKVHTLLRNSVRVNEIWSMFRAGDFPALQQPSIQTALVKICEYIGHQRNVSIVLAEETRVQAAQHPVGLKAFLRMLKHANNIKHDVLFKEVIPKEMGKWSSTTQELEKVSQMLNQGMVSEEIIASCEAGHLPTLKKPETQQPLVNIVEKQGHSVMVAQVLVEEAYRDAKEDRVLAEHAWTVLHEEELAHAAVLQVKEEALLVDKETHTSQYVTQETQQTLFIDEQRELETRELLPYRTQPLAQPRTETQITTKIVAQGAETHPLDTYETQQDVDYDEYSTDEQSLTEPLTTVTDIAQTKDVTIEQSQPAKKRQVRRVTKKIIRRPKSVEKIALKPFDATSTISEVETEHVTLKPVTKVESEESVLHITEREASAKLISTQMFYEQSDHAQLDIDSNTQLSTLQKLQDISDSKLIHTQEDESEIRLIKPKPIALETSKTTETVTKIEKLSIKPKPQTQLVETEQVNLKPAVQKTVRTSEKQQVEHVDLKPTKPKEIKQDTISEPVKLKPLVKTDVVKIPEPKPVDLKPLTKVTSTKPIPEAAKVTLRPTIAESPVLEQKPEEVTLEPMTLVEPEPAPQPETVTLTPLVKQEVAPGSPGTKRKIIKKKVVIKKPKPELEQAPEQIKFKTPKQHELSPDVEAEQVILKPFSIPSQPAPKPEPVQPVEQQPLTKLKPVVIPEREEVVLEAFEPTPIRKLPVEESKPDPVQLKPVPKPSPVEPVAEPEPVKRKPIQKSPKEEPQPESIQFKVKQRPAKPEPEPEEVRLKPIPKVPKPEPEIAPVELKPIQKPVSLEPIPESEAPKLKKVKKVIKPKTEPEPEIVSLKPFKRPVHEDEPVPEPIQLKPIEKKEKPEPEPEAHKLKPIQKPVKAEPEPEIIKLKPRQKPAEPEPAPEPIKLKPIPKPSKPEPEPEPVKLKPIQKPIEPVPEREPVQLTPFSKSEIPEPKPEPVQLQPIQKPVKPEPEPEPVVLKPIPKPEKAKPEPELEPEPLKFKRVQKPVEPEPEPELIKLKPIQKPDKPEPAPEPIKLKPVQKAAKPEPEPEPIKLKPVQKPVKPVPEPEPIKLKPVQKPAEPELEPEPIKLKPVQKPDKPFPEPEPIKLKPVQKPAKPEPKPEPIKLKPVQKPDKPVPEPKPIKLKPIQKPSKPEPEPEPIQLKPVKKTEKPVPEPEPISLKPTLKPVKEKEIAPEEPKLKPGKPLKPKSEPEPEKITLKPVQKPSKTEPVPQPVTPKLKSETKPEEPKVVVQQSEEVLVEQTVPVSSSRFVEDTAQKVIQQDFYQTMQQTHHVQMVQQSSTQMQFQIAEEQQIITPRIEQVQQTIIEEAPKSRIDISQTIVKISPQSSPVFEKESGFVQQQVSTQDVTMTREVRQFEQVDVQQPQVIMREMQTITSMQPEIVQTVTQQVITGQATTGQQERTLETVTVKQTTVTQEANKSPTVVRKIKKIIKKPKKETTVTVEEVHEFPVVDDVTIVRKTVVEQPEVIVRKQEQVVESHVQFSQQQQVIQQRIEQQQQTVIQEQHQVVQQQQEVVQQTVVQQKQQVSTQKKVERQVVQEEVIQQEVTRLPKVDVAAVSSVPSLKTASAAQVVVKEDTQMSVSSTITIEAVSAQDVKVGDQLRAIATYVAEEEHENSMHLVEGERVYVLESINSDWWFVEKHLTKERGYVPAKLLAVDASYTLYVKRKLEDKISKLNVFEKLKKGQKAENPKITQMLESQTIVDGQEVQFVVKVEGTPRPNVTWFRQTAIIKPSEEFQVFYSEDNTATLVIKEVFPEDAGLFTCVVKNLAGYAISEAELIVEGPVSDHGSETTIFSRRSLSRDSSVCDIMEGIPPTFAMKSITKTCEENAQFEVDVRLVAIPEPEIVWKKGGLILRDSNRIRIVRQKDVHAYRSIILIKGTKKDDEGEYEVYCKNREGEAKCNILLKITAPEAPLFEEKFSDTTVEEDGTIRLVARIRGVPTPDIAWSRNGKKITLSNTVIARYEDETAVLEVQHASTKTDAGKYVCTATNKVGKASHSASVTVGSDVVTFKRGLESSVVEENAEAVLECRTSREKEVKWWKGKMELKSSERILIEQEGLTHRIVIHSAAVSDTGKYKCTFDDQSTWCNFTVKPLEEFIQKLLDFEVMEKEEAVFYVEVSTEKAVITWHKDGEEITGNDRVKVEVDGKIRRLVISSTNLLDEGEYTCVLGDLESTCELTVRELPAEIVKDMEDQTVNKAEKASFAVELSKGDAVVTWFKDGQEIRFSDHYQLSIDGKVQRLLIYNCQTEDTGVYRAVVGKTECSAKLEVEAQAEGDFTKKLPSQMDVISNTDAEFTVEITKADRDVKWFRNGEEVSASARFIIKKKKNVRTLTVKSVTIEDTAEYTCVLGSLKTSCKMNVLVLESAPTVDRSSIQTEYVVIKGTDVTFTVPFKATPQPTATWSHKGKEIKQSKRLMPTIAENVASFTIYQVENIDCGEYCLKLANSCGEVSIDFVLKILDKPSRPGAPEALRVTNDSVTLHWRAPEDDGGRIIINYIIEYTFRKETKWVVYNSSETISETTVKVTRLTKDEEYSFRVAAVNEVGISEYSEQSEYIKVAEPIRPEAPMVKEFLEPLVTSLRQLVVLRCVITGTPVPDITWTKNERVITSNTSYENFTATLTIKKTDSSTSGMYTCKASNSAGSAETSATVVIQEAPQFEFDEKSQAQRLFVGERWHVPIKVTGFPQPKISWTCNDQPIQNFSRVVVHIEESEGLTDIAIQKLAFDDSAVFAITAQNSAGKATISFNLRVDEEEIIVKEAEKERPAAPAGPLDITDITTCSARLTWRPSPHDGGSEITSYYIEKLEKGQKQWHKVAEVDPNVFSYVVESLNEGREYFFRVFALNAIGLSEALEATETIFIKSPFNPPGPPLGPFDVTDMTETSLVLHWDEPLEDGGSPITGYTIERRTAMKKAWQKIGQTEGDVTQFECTSLKKGYTYFFRVFAVNVAGQGPPLQPDEAITAGKKLSVPSKPNGLTVIDVTSKTVTLGWSPPSTTGGADLIGYVIEKRLTIESASWEKVQTVDSSVTLYCVENLLEKSEYEFRVFAENPVGLSEEAAVTEYVQLKTHATPPSPPTAPLEARPTGPTSLMIEWGAPESDGGSPLLGYIIAIRDIKRTMWIEVGQVDANFTRLHIKEVQEEHEYNVRVFARNEIGASDPLQTEDPVKIIRPDDFQEVPEEDAAPSLSYSTTETLSWMREAGVDADIYSYARGRLLNRDEYFFKVWHQTQQIRKEEEEGRGGGGEK